MATVVVLDSRPVSQIVHPKLFPEITAWYNALLCSNRIVVVPEIVDYEVRRGLLRIPAPRQLENLDGILDVVLYLPLSTILMRDAAQIWADARRRGHPFTDDERLDGDAILIAHPRPMGLGHIEGCDTSSERNTENADKTTRTFTKRRRVSGFCNRDPSISPRPIRRLPGRRHQWYPEKPPHYPH